MSSLLSIDLIFRYCFSSQSRPFLPAAATSKTPVVITEEAEYESQNAKSDENNDRNVEQDQGEVGEEIFEGLPSVKDDDADNSVEQELQARQKEVEALNLRNKELEKERAALLKQLEGHSQAKRKNEEEEEEDETNSGGSFPFFRTLSLLLLIHLLLKLWR